MSYRQPITQTPYPGMNIQQPVVVSGMPYQQPYYPNYQNPLPQTIKMVNQSNVIKTQNPNAPDYHIDSSIRNQMNTLKKLIERAENLRNSRDNCSSPFEIRWRCVTDPFPSFWKFERDQICNLSENFPSDFPTQTDQNLAMNYPKINEPRIQPNISNIPPNSATSLPTNPAYNGNALPPRSQSPQVSVVATNFIPQRQPSPEIVVNSLPPKNIITNQTNYSNGIPPSNIIIPNNNPMQRTVSDFDANNPNAINTVTLNNMPANNYNNTINSVGMGNSAQNPGYNFAPSINNPPYNSANGFAPNTNYNDPNNYSNAGYNNSTGYNYNGYNNSNTNTGNNMYNNVYNKGYPNYNNPNSNIGYRKQGFKPNNTNSVSNNNSKKHNARKRSRGGSQWTYKPGDQE